MKSENQVCSFELSKRLKELGVKQESYFHYGRVEDPCFNEVKENVIFTQTHWQWNESCSYYVTCSAFTVAELFDLLPHTICEFFTLTIVKHYDEYQISYDQISSGDYCESKATVNNENLANGLAEILINLIENGLIENE